MEQSSAATPQPTSPAPAGAGDATDAGEEPTRPGFAARGRLRRRARFLRKARELAYRDLGGLVFSLQRFGQRNDELVLAKLSTLEQIDSELRALESSLHERQPVTVLREAGITACPRCAAIHGSEDGFCANCGLPLRRNVDLPVAGPASVAASPSPAAAGGGGPSRGWSPPAAGPPQPTPAWQPSQAASTPPPAAGTSRPPSIAAPPASSPGAAAADAPPAGTPPASAPPAGTPGPSSPGERGPASPAAPPPGSAPPAGPAPGVAPPAAPARADEDEPTEVVRPRSGST